MLKLGATLIATTTARTGQGGWSLDGGIDFIIWRPVRPAVANVSADAGRFVGGEPVSFLEADDILPSGMAGRARYAGLAAQEPGAGAGDLPDLPLTRAWSSMARKVPGS